MFYLVEFAAAAFDHEGVSEFGVRTDATSFSFSHDDFTELCNVHDDGVASRFRRVLKKIDFFKLTNGILTQNYKRS